MRYLLVAFLLMLATPAEAVVCWLQSRDHLAARLFSEQGQLPVFIGREIPMADDKTSWIIEVHAKPGGGSFTVFSWAESTGQICLIAHGAKWSSDKET